MAHDRLAGPIEIGQKLALQICIGIRDSPALAQVLGPGFDHLSRIGTVFGHAPHICLQSSMAQAPARTKGLPAERELLVS